MARPETLRLSHWSDCCDDEMDVWRCFYRYDTTQRRLVQPPPRQPARGKSPSSGMPPGAKKCGWREVRPLSPAGPSAWYHRIR